MLLIQEITLSANYLLNNINIEYRMKIRTSLIIVLVSLFTMTMYGQQTVNRDLTVSGVVLDTFGDPLPGVGIFIKNAPGIGTVTDSNGRFSMKAARREVIVFQIDK